MRIGVLRDTVSYTPHLKDISQNVEKSFYLQLNFKLFSKVISFKYSFKHVLSQKDDKSVCH